jgi:hypothetical protein
MLAQIAAGGQSVDLHDTDGRFPRTALICPTYSATEFKQVLGRVCRAGGKSRSLQRVIFAAGTVEEEMRDAVEAKLENLDLLLDADFSVQPRPDRPRHRGDALSALRRKFL